MKLLQTVPRSGVQRPRRSEDDTRQHRLQGRSRHICPGPAETLQVRLVQAC